MSKPNAGESEDSVNPANTPNTQRISKTTSQGLLSHLPPLPTTPATALTLSTASSNLDTKYHTTPSPATPITTTTLTTTATSPPPVRARPGPSIQHVQRPKNVGTWAGRSFIDNTAPNSGGGTPGSSSPGSSNPHSNTIAAEERNRPSTRGHLSLHRNAGVVASPKSTTVTATSATTTTGALTRSLPSQKEGSEVSSDSEESKDPVKLNSSGKALQKSSSKSNLVREENVDLLKSPREFLRTATTPASGRAPSPHASPASKPSKKLSKVSEDSESVVVKRSSLLFGSDDPNSDSVLQLETNEWEAKNNEEIDEADEDDVRADNKGDHAASDVEDDIVDPAVKKSEQSEDGVEDDDYSYTDSDDSDISNEIQSGFVASIVPSKPTNPLPPSLLSKVLLTLDIPSTISAKFYLPSSAPFSASILTDLTLHTLKHNVLTRNVDILETFPNEAEDIRKVVDESEWVFQAGDLADEHVLECEDLKLFDVAYFMHCIRSQVTPLLTLVHRSDLEIREDQIAYILGKPTPNSPALQKFRTDMSYSLNRSFSVNFFGIPLRNEIPSWIAEKRPKFEVQIVRPQSPSSPPGFSKGVLPIPVECEYTWSAFDLLKFLSERYPFLFNEFKVDPFEYTFKIQGVEQYIVTVMKLLAFEQVQQLFRFNRPIVLLMYLRHSLPPEIHQKIRQWEIIQNYSSVIPFDCIDKPADKINNILMKGYRSSWDVAVSIQVMKVTVPKLVLEFPRAKRIIKDIQPTFLTVTMSVFHMGELIGVPGSTISLPIFSSSESLPSSASSAATPITPSSFYTFVCTTQMTAPFNRLPLGSVLLFQVFAITAVTTPRKEERLGWGSVRIFDKDGVSLNGSVKVRCCDGPDMVTELIDEHEPNTLGKEFEMEIDILPTGAKIAFPDKFVQDEYFKKNKNEFKNILASGGGPNTGVISGSSSAGAGSAVTSMSDTVPVEEPPSTVQVMSATMPAQPAHQDEDKKGLGILTSKKTKKKGGTSGAETAVTSTVAITTNANNPNSAASANTTTSSTANTKAKDIITHHNLEIGKFFEKLRKNPNFQVTPDQKALLANSIGFCTSNYWAIAKFILCISWNVPKVLQEVYALLRDDIELEPFSALELLQYQCRDKYIRRFAVKQLQKLPDDDLSDLILPLVLCLKYERDDDSALARLLITRGILSPLKIGCPLFWLLLDQTLTSPYKRRFENVLYVFLYHSHYRYQYLYQLEIHEKLREIISEMPQIPEYERNNFLKQQLKEFEFTDYYLLPTNSNGVLLSGFAIDKCSYVEITKSLEIVFHNADPYAEDSQITFKKFDHLKYQHFMLEMLKIIDKLWLEANIDLKLLLHSQVFLTLPQLPSTIPAYTLYGFVELPQPALKVDTIYRSFDTANRSKKFLLNWLLLYNPPASGAFGDAQKRFIRSCAAYSIACYVLGLGNRAASTILCSKNGHIIHTDLQKSKSLTPVLTDAFRPEFVTVVGNHPNDAHFKWFSALCSSAYNMIRKHAPVFLRLIKIMAESNFAQMESSDVTRLIDILQLHKTHSDATSTVTELIESCLQHPLTKWEGGSPSSTTLTTTTVTSTTTAIVPKKGLGQQQVIIDTVNTLMTSTIKL